MASKGFQQIFLEAVDNAFSSLGDSARQAIYFHLEIKFKMPREQIPTRLKDFENGLEKIFGAGTRFLEILIMKQLHEMTGPQRRVFQWDEDKEFKFTEYVKTAEKAFCRAKKRPRPRARKKVRTRFMKKK